MPPSRRNLGKFRLMFPQDFDHSVNHTPLLISGTHVRRRLESHRRSRGVPLQVKGDRRWIAVPASECLLRVIE